MCRSGELTDVEIEKCIDVVSNPLSKQAITIDYDIPKWLLNRKKDTKDGTYSHLVANNWDTKMREDLERMKKIKYTFPLNLDYIVV